MQTCSFSLRLRAFICGLAVAGVLALSALPAFAQGGEGEMSLEEVSRMMDNPLGNLWIIFMENDLMRYRGDPARHSKWINSFTIQPILPVPLTKNWNLVTRPIIPLVSAPLLSLSAPDFGDCPGNCNTPPRNPGALLSLVDASRETAWGDIMVWSMLSPSEPRELPDGSKFVWGLGPAARFPTATEDQFGSERYSFGPSQVLMRLPAKDGKWTLGLFHQHHLWSIGGNDDRARVKTSQIQYIWYWKPPWEGWSIGAAPMIDVNWEADNDDKWSIPIGIGASKTMFLGPMPIRMGAEFNWFVKSPDNYGKKFMIKFYIVPVIPRLVKEPIFGG
jgi:hypothetical protein